MYNVIIRHLHILLSVYHPKCSLLLSPFIWTLYLLHPFPQNPSSLLNSILLSVSVRGFLLVCFVHLFIAFSFISHIRVKSYISYYLVHSRKICPTLVYFMQNLESKRNFWKPAHGFWPDVCDKLQRNVSLAFLSSLPPPISHSCSKLLHLTSLSSGTCSLHITYARQVSC